MLVAWLCLGLIADKDQLVHKVHFFYSCRPMFIPTIFKAIYSGLTHLLETFLSIYYSFGKTMLSNVTLELSFY